MSKEIELNSTGSQAEIGNSDIPDGAKDIRGSGLTDQSDPEEHKIDPLPPYIAEKTTEPSSAKTPPGNTEIPPPPIWKKAIKSASFLIWGIVILLVLLQLLGRFSIDHIKAGASQVTMTVPAKALPRLDAEINASLDRGLEKAQSVASQELDEWLTEMKNRVDPKFLDWYFDYFNQLGLGLKGTWINLTISSDEEKAEKLLETFQREFTKQVFQPDLAQLELERITRDATKAYMGQLSRELAGIQSKYDIPQADWDRYLSGIAYTVLTSEGAQQNLNLRDTARLGGYLLVKPVIVSVSTKIVSKIGSKKASAAATKIATKAAAKVATKTTGAATAATIGLELLDPLAGLGILVWDVWDHHHTVKVERPILKANLEKYLIELKYSLLDNAEGSIMSAVYQLDTGLRQQLL